MENSSDYPVSFYFDLIFQGESLGFQEVSGISKELQIEEITSGGEDRFKYRLPVNSEYQNLVLKRALVPSGSKLIQWCHESIDGGLKKPIKTHDVTLNLLNAQGEAMVSWEFYNAYPVKYSVSDLRSDVNALAIETIELAYTYFDLRSQNPSQKPQ